MCDCTVYFCVIDCKDHGINSMRGLCTCMHNTITLSWFSFLPREGSGGSIPLPLVFARKLEIPLFQILVYDLLIVISLYMIIIINNFPRSFDPSLVDNLTSTIHCSHHLISFHWKYSFLIPILLSIIFHRNVNLLYKSWQIIIIIDVARQIMYTLSSNIIIDR